MENSTTNHWGVNYKMKDFSLKTGGFEQIKNQNVSVVKPKIEEGKARRIFKRFCRKDRVHDVKNIKVDSFKLIYVPNYVMTANVSYVTFKVLVERTHTERTRTGGTAVSNGRGGYDFYDNYSSSTTTSKEWVDKTVKKFRSSVARWNFIENSPEKSLLQCEGKNQYEKEYYETYKKEEINKGKLLFYIGASTSTPDYQQLKQNCWMSLKKQMIGRRSGWKDIRIDNHDATYSDLKVEYFPVYFIKGFNGKGEPFICYVDAVTKRCVLDMKVVEKKTTQNKVSKVIQYFFAVVFVGLPLLFLETTSPDQIEKYHRRGKRAYKKRINYFKFFKRVFICIALILLFFIIMFATGNMHF